MNEYNDRKLILSRLHKTQIYTKYVDEIFKIYSYLEKDLNCFNAFLLINCNSKIDGHIGISGGMLYWLLYQEAKSLGLMDDLDAEVKKSFNHFRSIDFDLQCQIVSEDFSENSKYFEMYILNFFLSISKYGLFNNIENILDAKYFKHKIPITKKIGYVFNVNAQEDAASYQEYRPQLIFKSGKEIDHVIELLMVNGRVGLYEYNLIKSNKNFYGEHIMDSIPSQCFPRYLNTAIDIKKPLEEIKEDFMKNPLAKLKFDQGGIRVRVIYHILKHFEYNHKPETNGLKFTILCNNEILTKNLFRFRAKSIGKILPKNLINEALDLRRVILKLDPLAKSNVTNAVNYCGVYLKTWEFFINK